MIYKNIQIIYIFIAFIITVLSIPILNNDENINSISHTVISSDKESFINIGNNFLENIDVSDFDTEELNNLLILDNSSKVIFNWTMSPAELDNFINSVNEKTKKLIQVTMVPDEQCSFETVIVPVGYLYFNELTTDIQNLNLFKKSSKNNDIIKKLSDFLNYVSNQSQQLIIELIPKIYQAVTNIQLKKVSLPEDIDDKIFMEKLLLYLENFDIPLFYSDANKYYKLNEINNKISTIENNYINNIYNDNSNSTFTKEELCGIPESILNDFEKITKDGDEVYIISLKYRIISELLPYLENENTRKLITISSNQILKSNIDLLKDVINLRFKKAKLSGFKTFSDYKLKNEVAKNPKNVKKFLKDLKDKFQSKAKEEISKLLELKKMEKEEFYETFDNVINEWDYKYYDSKLKNYDFEEIKKYFPCDKVTKELLNIYGNLFSLNFVKVENPNVWSLDVLEYNVYDRKTNDFIGTIYLDLYERSGKYSGSYTLSLSPGFSTFNGSRSYPMILMNVNFPISSEDKPSLLTYENVVTYFHEMGHVIHKLSSESKWALFDNSLQHDFLETPSQLMEFLLLEPEIIEKISHHYQDSRKKIPKDLIHSIINKRKIDLSLEQLETILLSMFDIKINSIKSEELDFDLIDLWKKLYNDIILFKNPEPSWFFAQVPHLMNGYESVYYSYIWTFAYAADIYYTKFKPKGIINPDVGEQYRNMILKKSYLFDIKDLLKEYLGREPNQDALINLLQ